MRWKKLAVSVLRSNTRSLADPYKLLLVVTKRCHSRCRNCNIWRSGVENELSLEEIEKIATRNTFIQWLNITGGEPTERPDLPEIVAAFLRHCPDLIFVNFATNGLHPERIAETCAKIKALGPPRFVVTVSVDGPPGVNDELRGVPGNFRRSAETFRRLREAGVECYAGLTLYPENFRLLGQTIAALDEAVGGFRPHDLHVNLAHSSPHYYGTTSQAAAPAAELAAALADFRRARGWPLSPFEWLERAYLKKAEDFVRSARAPVPCAALLSSVYVSELGTVYPCSIWNKPLGSLRDSGYSLRAVLSRAADVRAEIARSQCPTCWTPCEAYPSLAANLW